MIDDDLIKKLSYLSKEDKEELSEELISYLTENDVQLTPQERSFVFQFVKGHYGKLQTVVDVINRYDPGAVEKISLKYVNRELKPEVKIESKFQAPAPLEIKNNPKIDVHSQKLRERIGNLTKTISNDLVEDLLSILSDEELKRLDLSQRERSDIMQLIKGHYNPASLFNALQVAVRALDEKKILTTPAIGRKIDREIRFGVELVPAMGLDKLVGFARKFEVGGIDNIWITDHYTNMDPYVTLTLVSNATSNANLGVGVTNPYMRHLASTASAIASLAHVSNNRMVLGLGAGDKSTLATLNIETKSALKIIDETVEAMRLLWTQDNVNFNGEIIKLDNARLNFKPESKIPIYIGAQGPNMLKLAGKIGDGVLVNASHELDFEYARKEVQAGVNVANKKLSDVDLTAYTCFSVGDDASKARKATVPVVAFIAAATPQNILERHDLDEKKALLMRDYIAKGDMAKAFQMVDDSFIDAFSVGGTPQQCVAKIENLKNAGVTQFVFGSPLGPKKNEAIKLITEKLLPNY